MKRIPNKNSKLYKAYTKYVQIMNIPNINGSRKNEAVAARAAFCYVAKRMKKWSLEEIASVMDKDHSNVVWLTNKAESGYYNYSEYFKDGVKMSETSILSFLKQEDKEVDREYLIDLEVANIELDGLNDRIRGIEVERKIAIKTSLERQETITKYRRAATKAIYAMDDLIRASESANSKLVALGYSPIETRALKQRILPLQELNKEVFRNDKKQLTI